MKRLFSKNSILAVALLINLPVGIASASIVYSQGFESDTSGWIDESSGWFGSVTRLASGYNDVNAFEGEFYALVESGGEGLKSPVIAFDEYRDVFPGEYRAQIAVYLDTSWILGAGFDYMVSSNGTDGKRQRNFYFHVTKDSSTGELLVGASNTFNYTATESLEDLNHFAIQSSGWYLLEHFFRNDDGILAVDLTLKDVLGSTLFSETLKNAEDTIPDEVGGNRYGAFFNVSLESGIAVDASQLLIFDVSAPQSFVLTFFGLISLFRLKRSV